MSVTASPSTSDTRMKRVYSDESFNQLSYCAQRYNRYVVAVPSVGRRILPWTGRKGRRCATSFNASMRHHHVGRRLKHCLFNVILIPAEWSLMSYRCHETSRLVNVFTRFPARHVFHDLCFPLIMLLSLLRIPWKI